MAQPIFDSHLHIIDPAFPLVANHGYRPPPFTAVDYRAAVAALPIVGGSVVSGSFQAFDVGYLRAALTALGPGFVGVANVPAQATDADLIDLAHSGVRGVRFNLFRGGSESVAELTTFGRRAWAVARLHVELYLDAADLDQLADPIGRLPRVSIDHLGLTAAHRPTLLALAEAGVRIKATGFGRVELDVPGTLRQIHAANPHSLMVGTDLPGTRARRPFEPSDLTLIGDALGAAALPAVLHDNAVDFYRMDQTHEH